MDKMNVRQGVYLSSEPINDRMKLEFICSTRALIGIRTELMNETQGTAMIKSSFHEYKPYSGPLRRNNKGAIVSMCEGVTTPYILKEIEKFGTLFVKAGTKVYNGLVIGENNKDDDIEVNPTKEKKVTNVRTHSHDEKVILVPPKIMSIEEAICYIRDDELLEVTPKEVRIRKRELDKSGRDRARRDRKNESKNFKG
jgi:GTP-binding protein